MGFHAVVATREDLFIDVSITNVRQILTNLRLFQLFSTSQNSNFKLFGKKIKFLGFHGAWCSTRENLSIDVSITDVGLILTKLWWFLFSGYGQMDRQTDGQTWFWNPHMETCRHTKNFNSKLKISGYLSIPLCLPGGWGCIIGELFIYNDALIVPHGNTTGTHKHQSQVGRHIPTTRKCYNTAVNAFNGKAGHLVPVRLLGIPN